MSVICFGEVLIDFLSDGKTPESFTKYAGGAPANVAVGVSKLGGQSSFCGMLGDDMFGQFLHQELNSYGVNTHFCVTTSKAKTALAFVSLNNEGDRTFSFYRPPAADLLFKEKHFDPQMFSEHQYFHFCSNSLTEKSIYNATLSGLDMAKNQGALISFDVNLRLNLWPNTRYTAERIWHCIAKADIIKLAKEELTYLTRNSNQITSDEHTIARCLTSGARYVIITDGEKPIKLYSRSAQYDVAVTSVKATDTTAAGDSFMAGVLFTLQKNKNTLNNLADDILLNAIEFGAQCAAITVTRHGSFSALPVEGEC